jgi:hypothetical protein
MHGGSSLSGLASPSLKTGRYSKRLPERLAERYGEALADPKLMELRDEIALMGTRLGELVERLDTGESLRHWQSVQAAYRDIAAAIRISDKALLRAGLSALDTAVEAGLDNYATWKEIVDLTEARRKLVETEQKRLVAMQQMITSEQAMILLAVLTNIVRKHVTDPNVLASISTELKQLTVIEPS